LREIAWAPVIGFLTGAHTYGFMTEADVLFKAQPLLDLRFHGLPLLHHLVHQLILGALFLDEIHVIHVTTEKGND
jgi:hypothetical protein